MSDNERIKQLEQLIESKRAAFLRFNDYCHKKFPHANVGFYLRGLKLYQSKVEPLMKERDDLLSVQ